MPAASPRRRPPPLILGKLVVAYLVPTLAIFSLFAVYAHDLARRDLETELGKRLAGIAAATAAQLRGKYLVELEPGEEAPRAYLNTRRKLEASMRATGAGRIMVFRPDFTSLCDTAPGVAVGAAYHELELDRHELARVFADGAAVSSVLFRGSDGRHHKAGYAAVRASEDDDRIVAALRVEAPAEYFGELALLRRRLVTYGVLLAAAVAVVSLVVAALLTRPLRRLSVAAERIGRGDLAAPVPGKGSDEIGVLARTLDEMREALRARDERMRMMLAGIAHEVRNPLGGIELYAGILRDELGADAEKQGHVARIERELGHLQAVVRDFLDYARRPKPELGAVALAPIVAELRDLVEAEADAAGVHLLASAPEVRVLADADQLRRALLNLVKNAVQATPAGGRVALTATATDDGHVRLQVADTGKGIPNDEKDKIFAPFYTTKEKGTGLGLAFAKEIVADHGGTLAVDSRPGHGAAFAFELRRATWE